MTKKPVSPAEGSELIRALHKLESSVDRLPRQFEYVIHPGKHLFVAYLQGILYGLGALTAFAILIPLFVTMLRHVEWVPILGDFIGRIATQVEHVQRR